MGQMRFVIPRPERLVPGAAEQACLAGGEGTPWECRTTLEYDAMLIERETRESGYLYFPWNVVGRGLVVLISGSLMERPRAYNLPVELARGTLNRLRNQSSAWQSAGMVVPPRFHELLAEANRHFALAATRQDQPPAAADHADEAIRLGLIAADLLGREYAHQVLTIRRNQQSPLGTLLACRLQAPLSPDQFERFAAAFNTAIITPAWPTIEPKLGQYDWGATDALVDWCRERGIRVCMGPLVQLDRHLLPDWLFLDEGFEDVQSSLLTFLDAVVQRYRGKAQLWHVAARLNQDGAFEFSEEQRLRLAVDAVDRVRSLDSRTPAIVSFDQPWGEYIARRDQELTPLHFADTLVRGELGLAGIGIEMHYGYWPGGTLPRDPLDVSRQLDRWSQLGVPLMVLLSAPSAQGPDPAALHPSQPLPDLAPRPADAVWQASLVEWLSPLIVAKQSVQAFAWSAWQDELPHEWSHSGLIDAKARPKAALQALMDLRRDWIG
jgi:hypothetical protein